MANIYKPYSTTGNLGGCSCGAHHTQADHDAQAMQADSLSNDFIEAALVKALFPQDALRRRFLEAVGVNTARAAIASVLPISAMQAIAQEKRPLEKTDLKIGKGDVNYKDIADKVFLLTDAKSRMKELGQKSPDVMLKKIRVMGRDFDPGKPEAYVNSFAIKRTWTQL